MGFVSRIYVVVRGWNFPELGGSSYLGSEAALESGGYNPMSQEALSSTLGSGQHH